MPVSTVISGGMAAPGVDQGLERAEALAAAHLHRADLGDAAVARRAAGGLEVDHAERDVVQRGAEVVEASAARRGSGIPLVDEQVFEGKDRARRRPEGRPTRRLGWPTSLPLHGVRQPHRGST